MEREEPTEIYHHADTKGLPIVDKNNHTVGFYAGKSKFIEGDSPQILIINACSSKQWISGLSIRIMGLGIKFIEDYKIYR